MENIKKTIFNYLAANANGRGRAIKAGYLACVFSIPERNVRELIAEMREAGQPIASAVHEPYGFYVPATYEEAEECLGHLYSRVEKIRCAFMGLKRGLNAKFGDQLTLRLNN
jgi:hypothetical protein